MHARTLFIALALTATASAQHSKWVYPAPDGHLVYLEDNRGNHIADFSYAGYMGGGVALPTVPTGTTLLPSGGDDTRALQSELDHTAQLAAKAGHAIALELAPGTFHLSATVNITSSNIVLRGAGSGKTILMLTGTPHLGIRIGEASASSADEDNDSPQSATAALASTTMADVYVPSGYNSFRVANPAGFAPGDTIRIDHTITPAYVAFMGMNLPDRDGKPERWVGSHIVIERRIVSIHDNNITVDVPFTDSYDPKYGGGSGTTVQKIPPPRRLSQVAVESLAIIAPSVRINLSDPHFDGIQIGATQDAWLRDLRLEDTINSISVTSSALRITIDHVDVLQRIPIQSSAKNFGYSLAGTQTLVMRSSLTGDKVFFAATQAREQGPNVILYCTFNGDQSLEPHQRWGTGLLVDNVTVHGGAINLYNRGTMGTGHGWTMGWGVVWNSSADTLTIQNPPGAINWAIGSSGQRVGKPMPISGAGKGNRPDLPEGLFDSPNKRVQPTSLYLQQLQDRLGPTAVKAIGF